MTMAQANVLLEPGDDAACLQARAQAVGSRKTFFLSHVSEVGGCLALGVVQIRLK